jgi:DNA polymerase I
MIKAWLLDVDYITEHGRAVIRLWCKDEKGVFVAYDRNFQPYFYVLGCSRDEVLNVKVKTKDEIITPLKVEEIEAKSLGKPVKALKVYTRHPQHVPKLREEIKKFADVREADIPFAYRYLIDKDLACMDGVLIDATPRGEGVVRVYEVKDIKRCEMDGFPDLKVLAFDCEMLAQFMPDPEKDPIIAIAVKCGDFEEVLHGDEKEIIRRFVNLIKELDPDVIVGYNQDSFDWPYLKKRAERYGIKLDIGRDRSEISFRGGRPKIAGRLDVDLYDIALKMPDVKIKTLKNVAEYLGAKLEEDIGGKDIYKCWVRGEIDKILKHAKNDVLATYSIAEELLPMHYELSRMIKLPLDDITRMGRGKQVDYFLLSEARRIGEIAPNPPEIEESYEGAFVLEPKRGLHENVVSLDFMSMYPSIMIAYNISPDTLVKGKCDDCYRAPEVGHYFKKSPDGFFKRILKMLIEKRREMKKKMKELDPNSQEYRLLDIKQQTLKILTNSFYGYTGWNVARWYCRECAEATTAWGRYFIKRAAKIAESMGFEVLYGDTDSLFVKKDKLDLANLKNEVEKLIEVISRELPIQLEIDEFYKAIFFVEKKRYAGLTQDGRIIVKGLEVRRGDWCELAKKIQKEVIEIILKEKNPKKALEFVKRVIEEIKESKIPLEDYVIYKGLTKRPDKYESKQAHVKAALRAMEMGIVYPIGTKVGFIIVRGAGNVSDRAYPIDLIEEFDGENLYIRQPSGIIVKKIDKDYYIDHQVVPSVLRILERFGYTEANIKGSAQKTLFDFG